MNDNLREEKQFEKGDVFRYTGPGSDKVKTGQLCIFERETTWSDAGGVRLYSYRETYTDDFFVEYAEFRRDYARVAGEDAIDGEIKRTLTEAVGIKTEIETLNVRIESYGSVTRGGALPNLTEPEIRLLAEENDDAADDDEHETAGPAASSELMPQMPDNPISLARTLGTEVAGYRNLLNDKKTALSNLKQRVGQLQKLKNRQIEILLGFKDLGEKIEKVLTTIQLYLGTGEEIVQIRHGAWASPDEKLSLRQLCLFMDTESQILLDQGGMDFKNIQQFDEWLLSDPRHLQQILPEQKGMVCLKPRRERKEYSESKYINDLINARNVQTYILIRHGENLFRVTPDWQVGSRLFPSRREFDQFFRGSKFDYTERKYVDYVITPESREFAAAVAKMSAENLHYRNTLVMIQGIIDRTGIFKDLQERGVNLLDIKQNQNEIVYINDGDENYLLRNGKETFREYQTRLNSQLNVGNRIILGRYTDGSARSDKRIYPATATYPSLDELYLIEKNSSGDFVIRYERTDTIYAYSSDLGYYSKDPEKRASFKIYKDDKFILAYDLASADEMNEFINDRLSREAYLDLLPLLKTIRKLKLAEEREEEEFLLLIAGELMKTDPDGSAEEHRKTARRLINWFKFKNRWHRALKDDYEKAFRMIMKEYRLENRPDGATVPADVETEAIMTPETLFIGRQKRQIVRLERADNFGVLLNRTNFSLDKNGFRELGRKENFVLRKDLLNTEEIYAHADWGKWLYGYDLKHDYVAENDAEVFLAMLERPESPLAAEVAKQLRRISDRSFGHERGKRILTKSLPLAVYVCGSRIIVVYYINYTMDGNSSSCPAPLINRLEFVLGKYDGYDCVNYRQQDCEMKKLDELMNAGHGGPWFPKLEKLHYIRLFDENFLEVHADFIESGRRRQHIAGVKAMMKQKVEDLRAEINSELESRAKKVYLESFGDERNWEYYRKNSGIDFVAWDEVRILAETLGDFWLAVDDAGERLASKTLNELKVIIPQVKVDGWQRESATFPPRVFALGFGSHVFFPPAADEEETAQS